jgi:lipoprotein-releasing system permease protein
VATKNSSTNHRTRLNTENIVVLPHFTLVIVVALFNLIGALIMMILDKKGNLKTLFN